MGLARAVAPLRDAWGVLPVSRGPLWPWPTYRPPVLWQWPPRRGWRVGLGPCACGSVDTAGLAPSSCCPGSLWVVGRAAGVYADCRWRGGDRPRRLRPEPDGPGYDRLWCWRPDGAAHHWTMLLGSGLKRPCGGLGLSTRVKSPSAATVVTAVVHWTPRRACKASTTGASRQVCPWSWRACSRRGRRSVCALTARRYCLEDDVAGPVWDSRLRSASCGGLAPRWPGPCSGCHAAARKL